MSQEINITEDNILTKPVDKDAEDYKYTTIGQFFLDKMEQYKNNICQIDAVTGTAQTFGEIRSRSIRVAMEMKARGIKSGDIVSICTKNYLDTCLPLIASFYIGAKVASLDASLSKNDLVHLINLVQPKIIFADDNAVPILEKSLKEVDFEIPLVVFGKSKKHSSFIDFLKGNPKEEIFEIYQTKDPKETVVIFFSSGTTGLPKGICVNQYGLIQQCYNFMKLLDLKETDVSLFYSPLYWLTAIMNIVSLTMCGGARIIAPPYTQDSFLQIIEKYKVTFTFMSPTNAFKLTSIPEIFNKYDVSSLRTICLGGSPVTEDYMKKAQQLFSSAVVMNAYGMTETAGITTAFYAKTDTKLLYSKYVSCGKPIPGIQYKVVDLETGKSLGPYQRGELRLKSPYLMNGYHNNPEGTKAAWDEDGWLITGDVVYYDDDYCFYIVDRLKEMLKYQNWHITPSELEGIILQHPCVEEVVVIGIPDSTDGDHAMAVIVQKPGFNTTEEEIVKYVDERVTDSKRLRGGVTFVDRLPLTASGKIDRRSSRKMVLDRLSK